MATCGVSGRAPDFVSEGAHAGAKWAPIVGGETRPEPAFTKSAQADPDGSRCGSAPPLTTVVRRCARPPRWLAANLEARWAQPVGYRDRAAEGHPHESRFMNLAGITTPRAGGSGAASRARTRPPVPLSTSSVGCPSCRASTEHAGPWKIDESHQRQDAGDNKV